jgi:hypothetical protein
MGDSYNNLQTQFEIFMKMYQENRQQDRTEREHLSARIEELSCDLAALEVQQGVDGSVNRGLRGNPQLINRLEGRMQTPRYRRLEFPFYDEKITRLPGLAVVIITSAAATFQRKKR